MSPRDSYPDPAPDSVSSTAEQRRHRRRIPSFAELRRHWREDYDANGRKFTRPGFQAVAVYRLGVWVDGHPNRFLRYPLRKLYQALYVMVRNLYGIELPFRAQVGRRLHIGHQSGIVISSFCTIGDDCLILQNVTIGSNRVGSLEDRPIIGDRVQIGVGAVLLGPIEIGHDTRIGPNTVVRESVPPNCKVLPARPDVQPRSTRHP